MKIPISFLLLLCFISTCSSSPLSISDGVFTFQASVGRNLLQSKTKCPVNFETANYTIITSRCKAPYPAIPCCDAFKEFACPYSEALNDLSSDCSDTMFNYLNLYGNYTVGLFANICRDDKIGLICPASPPVAEGDNVGANSNNSPKIRSSSVLALTTGFLILFL